MLMAGAWLCEGQSRIPRRERRDSRVCLPLLHWADRQGAYMNSPKLMTRDDFRAKVFARDGGRCVFCKAPAADAHHIMERRLFPDGGYYMENGASVCELHHLECEKTEIPVEMVREACGITRPVLPPDYYPDQRYDKWGNPILADGRRLRGELFFDESVQKVLAAGGKLREFTGYVKYPRTRHLPWSEGVTDDDRVMDDLSKLEGREVVVTEKMDGENTTMYRDFIHARSIDGRPHPSRSWVKNLHGRIAGDMPEGWRLCGENLFAEHSIPYDSLASYFLGFSVWTEKNECLAWDETLEWLTLFGVMPVPVLYRGIFDAVKVRALYVAKRDWERREGYVVRPAGRFHYGEFPRVVGKFVRAGHARTVKHWMRGPFRRNGLASQ